MKIIFMGTPEFAVPSLEKIGKNNEIISVFTKIDRPNSRGKKINYSPIKEYALSKGINIYQPTSFDRDIIENIRQMEPDLIVVVAYGKILPKEVIDIPKYGVINVHSSLLPKYRGAAPINAAIINGEEKSGVSIMYVEERLDAGDVILQQETEISEEDTFQTLHDRLKIMGANLLDETIKMMSNNEQINAKKQDEREASFVKPFKKEDCHIDWNLSSKEIFNKVRGMNPIPGAFSKLNDKFLKVYSVKPYEKKYEMAKNGEVVEHLKGEGIVVKTNDASVIIKLAKPENKKILTGKDLINGNLLKIGEKLC